MQKWTDLQSYLILVLFSQYWIELQDKGRKVTEDLDDTSNHLNLLDIKQYVQQLQNPLQLHVANSRR